MNKLIITVEGPPHCGKTLLLEKIGELLTSVGVEYEVDSLDSDFGKFKDAVVQGKTVPGLGMVVKREGCSVVLKEKHNNHFLGSRVMVSGTEVPLLFMIDPTTNKESTK